MLGCLFDVDGTLLDSMQVWDGLSDALLAEYQLTGYEDLDGRYTQMNIKEALQDLHASYMSHVDMAEMVGVLQDLIHQRYASLTLKAGAYSFVETLASQGVRMGIVSAGERAVSEAVLTKHQIMPLMQFYMSSDEEGIEKSCPEIFLLAAKRLGIKPEDIVVIDDSYHAIKAAKQAGMQVWAIAEKRQRHDEENIIALADHYMNSFVEMEEYLLTSS